MTFGDIPASPITRPCSRSDALRVLAGGPAHPGAAGTAPAGTPARVRTVTPTTRTDPTDKKAHIVIGWLLGESTDLEQLLEAQLLSSVLLDNSASPLQQALETTRLGQSPSPLCGLEDAMRELVFCCGIEGSEAENTRCPGGAGAGGDRARRRRGRQP